MVNAKRHQAIPFGSIPLLSLWPRLVLLLYLLRTPLDDYRHTHSLMFSSGKIRVLLYFEVYVHELIQVIV